MGTTGDFGVAALCGEIQEHNNKQIMTIILIRTRSLIKIKLHCGGEDR